jgi:hypothetical protein
MQLRSLKMKEDTARMDADQMQYCKPIFIRVRENFARFARTPSFANTYRREPDIEYRPILMSSAESRTLIAVNQFITEKLRNIVAANKSWFTVFKPIGYTIVSYK